MSKYESPPPFRMLLSDGKLLPSSAWEQERLATFRNGSTVTVQITQEKNRKLERKYWAILGRVVKDCPVKQRTAEDLHRAIRLKLGVVEAFFNFDGKLKVEVKSTSTMDDPEYQRFYEDAMALLQSEVGIDPETLNAESADVGADDPEPASSPVPQDDAAGSGGNPPSAAAADQSEPAEQVSRPAEQQGADGGEADGPASPSAPEGNILRNKMLECLDKFIAVASDPKVPDARDRQDNVIFVKDAWKEALPDRPDFVKACVDLANRIVLGKTTKDTARAELTRWLS